MSCDQGMVKCVVPWIQAQEEIKCLVIILPLSPLADL